jgi:hypothetical protein
LIKKILEKNKVCGISDEVLDRLTCKPQKPRTENLFFIQVWGLSQIALRLANLWIRMVSRHSDPMNDWLGWHHGIGF